MEAKRIMTGRALCVKEDDFKQMFIGVVVDIMLSEDETDLDEVQQKWTVFINATKGYYEHEYTITQVSLISQDNAFAPPEVLSHVSENYEMITGLIKRMVESGERKEYEYSIEYDEPDETGDEDDDDAEEYCCCHDSQSEKVCMNIGINLIVM